MNKFIFVLSIFYLLEGAAMATDRADMIQQQNPLSPAKAVKLLFIHHSVGGQWLAHDHGKLVSELNKNNFYVNDVTYRWEPSLLTNSPLKKVKRFIQKARRKMAGKLGKGYDESGAYGIGNRTDIGHMPEWFLGSESELIMESIYKENLTTSRYGDSKNSTSKNPLSTPDATKENHVIMFKSCYPNTLLKGNPYDQPNRADPPPLIFRAGSDEHTVSNAKRVFNELLTYFGKRQDKFFVIITPPPMNNLPEDGAIARGFTNWLVHNWLKENNYQANNVMVFDLFNVLTSGHGSVKNDFGEEQGNHHRILSGEVQHTVHVKNNLLVYPNAKGDSHPSAAGLQKATKEFVPLLNLYYTRWQTESNK